VVSLAQKVRKCCMKKEVLSPLFEKLRDARDKTLVCKNRKPKKIV
jgi:hypothetical protein